MSANEYGFDYKYMEKRMARMLSDIKWFTPNEAFNELSRMTMVAANQAGLSVTMKVKFKQQDKKICQCNGCKSSRSKNGGYQPCKHVYGSCPKCGSYGVSRERRIDGNDRCSEGHTYPSKHAIEAKRR